MFEEMGDAGLALRLIGRAHPIPDHVGDDGRPMIGNDHDLQAISESEGLGQRLGGGKRSRQNGKQAQSSESSIKPAALEAHKVTSGS